MEGCPIFAADLKCKASARKREGWRKEIGEAMARERAEAPLRRKIRGRKGNLGRSTYA